MDLVSDNPDNVVPLFRKRDELVAGRKHCYHGGTMLIDPDTRLVQCGLCETWLDSFTALEILTREWSRHVEATKWAKYKYEQLRDKVSDLKREEINAKSRLRRARKRLAADEKGQ